MITFEKRGIAYEPYDIPINEIERLLATASEYDALYAMVDGIKVEWRVGGDVCTCTTMRTPSGDLLRIVVIPPRHRAVRGQHDESDYVIEVLDENGYLADRGRKYHKGRKRFDLDDCARIALALHKVMANSEKANSPM